MFASRLDYFFPFLVFFYGILMVFMLENSYFRRVGLTRMRALYDQLSAHKPIAWICFWVGGFWSLQNLIFT